MKYSTPLRLALSGAGIMMLSVMVSSAEPAPGLVLQPSSTLWLDGDSTLHPFSSQTTQLEAAVETDPASSPDGIISGVLTKNLLKKLDVVIPVRTLKSKESGLDKNMYKALKEDLYHEITFHLTGYDVTASTNASVWAVKASGVLHIAGKEQPVVLEGTVSTESQDLHVRGQYTLRMSEYGVKPPTLMMGAIKVKDPVTIHFDLHLALAETVQRR